MDFIRTPLSENRPVLVISTVTFHKRASIQPLLPSHPTAHIASAMAAARIAYARRIDLGALLESQQPVIDLHTQEYEVATRRFLKAIQAYTTRGIEEIKNRQNKHSQELKKISEKKVAVEAETTACKVKEIELMKGERGTGFDWEKMVDNRVLVQCWRRRQRREKRQRSLSMN